VNDTIIPGIKSMDKKKSYKSTVDESKDEPPIDEEPSGVISINTKTQNEGKQHKSNPTFLSDAHITHGFEIDSNPAKNGENSNYTFTSKMENKNDELIAKNAANNEIIKNYLTRGANMIQTAKG